MRPDMKMGVGQFLAEAGKAAALCLALSAVAFVLFVLFFKLGLLAGITVLFYRGIILAALVSVSVFGAAGLMALRGAIHPSVALAAAAVSASINLTVLIVLPVTIDRSVTVFLLSHMDRHPHEAFTAADLERHFIKVYLDRFQQMQRRMDEQELSGNVERVGPGYRISPQGRSFVEMSRSVAWAFDTDPRFVDPDAAADGPGQR